MCETLEAGGLVPDVKLQFFFGTEEWEEVNEDDDMEADEEMVEEDAPPTNGTPSFNGPKKPSDYLEALIPTLLPLIRPTSLSYAPPFQQSLHPPTTSALGALHIAALECLNNVSLTLADALDGVSQEHTGIANGAGHSSAAGLVMNAWGEVWTMLATMGRPEGIGAGPEKKKEAWLVALGVLWAVGRICRGHLVRPGVAGLPRSLSVNCRTNVRNYKIPDAEQVQLLIEICNTVPDDASKVKCIGILECVAVHPSSVEANKVFRSLIGLSIQNTVYSTSLYNLPQGDLKLPSLSPPNQGDNHFSTTRSADTGRIVGYRHILGREFSMGCELPSGPVGESARSIGGRCAKGSQVD